MTNFVRYAALVAGGLLISATAALAGPAYVFSISEGTQPSDVGTVKLMQVDNNTVKVLVDLSDTDAPNPRYGFINTGSKTPFAFTLSGSEVGVSVIFYQPIGGGYASGGTGPVDATFSLNLLGGPGTPFGTYGVAIDSSAGNGTSNAYFGDLEFNLTRAGGLSIDDFITNAAIDTGGNGPAYFVADLTNGASNTGSQAWKIRASCTDCDTIQTSADLPEPASVMMLGAGLLGLGAARRRKRG